MKHIQSLVIISAFVGLIVAGVPNRAAAGEPIDVPLLNGGTTVIGMIDFYGGEIAAACFTSTNLLTQELLGLGLGGLDNSYDFYFYDGIDNVMMPAGAPVSACGTSFRPLKYNGRSIMLWLGGGADYFMGGGVSSSGNLSVLGEAGNDRIELYAAPAAASGGSGNDVLNSYQLGSVSLYGDDGNDCLNAQTWQFISCGTGTADRCTRSSLPASCELHASGC